MITFENASDFEKVVALLLEQEGWQITMPPANTKGYDIEAVKGSTVNAIQVKNHKAAVKVPQIEKFFDFIDLPIANKFTGGILVSSSGYTNQALTYFEQTKNNKVRLAIIRDGKVRIIGETPPPPPPAEPKYIGVFTCKGGVGKTTISAHLAGAFALSGYDVALIDLDPQKNLTTLLDEGLKLPGTKNRPGNTISVYNIDEWDFDNLPDDVSMVVCDCSPVLQENPTELIKKFSYCIIPTTLNPLGLNKNGYVILNTLKAIRSINKEAYLFVVINNYYGDDNGKSRVLKNQYQRFFSILSKQDPRFHFIDPDEVAIRNSKQLFYWGYHIYDGNLPELAFQSIGGRCLPKADFLKFLEYLEENSDIENAKIKQSVDL
ncbi:AAA family ATPase [Nostoc sp. UHCC 0702]|nr:AAA family ATPase [Nostoc sp. UHCC 0702]